MTLDAESYINLHKSHIKLNMLLFELFYFIKALFMFSFVEHDGKSNRHQTMNFMPEM